MPHGHWQRASTSDLLNNILNALLLRAQNGGMTHIYKVKYHTGVTGTEAVDKEAGAAAKNPTDPTHVQETSENEPYSKSSACCRGSGARKSSS
jgi:hypothetical protein